ncbi:3-hydroxyacyl-CoA dehydrogenase NAD-binding domain-containing protein [Staphylospora marina]|uniref:3-hydroxyacyl-CoA dehydrogenase NAD-binding domain-containing protein n=1 Tax=Staphylospora marina TaxID=2490858 RepID=UPI001F14D610|nr:3-hydroxyacyl-CoA dehydrogenase NAD-binding domain-containing protein [Staphylospora marina]
MSGSAFTRPAVIGAGTMGIGIAEVLAAAGHDVQVLELSREVFDRAMDGLRKRLSRQVEKGRLTAEQADAVSGRIRYAESVEELADRDIVIEAIVERLDVKKDLFARLEQSVSESTVLASNTSSLPITAIAAAVRHPGRVMGLHFFNPAPLMPLVEVISAAETDPELAERAYAWLKEIGKEPVKVSDSPGFLVNRVARPFHLEPYRIVGEGIASKEQVDRIMRAAGFKMGPFQLQDLIGIDINYAASVSVYEAYFHEPRLRPHFAQRMMVERGALGRKTGKGHYRYES